MKILHIAGTSVEIPPSGYGGTERIIHSLAKWQTDKGHDVTVLGIPNPNKNTRYEIKSIFKTKPKSFVPRLPSMVQSLYSLAQSLKNSFDIVHNHHITPGLQMTSLLNLLQIPSFTTLHYDPPLSNRKTSFYDVFNKSICVAISKNQRERLKNNLKIISHVYNGIDLDNFPFSKEKKDFFICLGAVHPVKGTHIAAKIANLKGIKLKIAGRIRSTSYFVKEVKPYLDSNIEFVGEVSEKNKKKLLGNAKALIFPVLRPEPFGLVAIESLACGTPVITFNIGALKEVVQDGKEGYLCKSVEEMKKSIDKIKYLNHRNCRERVKNNFTTDIMAKNHMKIYKKLSIQQL